MMFSRNALTFLAFAKLASAQEDLRPRPDKLACHKDRCIPMTLKNTGDNNVWGPLAATDWEYIDIGKTPTATQKVIDYDKYFDFAEYPVLCNICINEVPQAVATAAVVTVAYQRDSENCQKTPSNTAKPEMKIKREADKTVVITNSVPTHRILTAAFWEDKTKPASVDATTKAGYCISEFADFVDPCCLDSLAPSAKPTTAAPTTKSPTTQAPTTPAPKKNPCFSSVASVEVQGKGQTTMKELQVGDIVLTPNGYEKIYTIDHRNDNKITEFVQIFTEMEKPLELTSEHMVYLHGKNDPVEAGTVKVGDKLKSFVESSVRYADVKHIGSVSRKGLFNPITSSGTIIVDGIATSTYTAVDITGSSNYLVVGGYRLLSMHDFMHLAMEPFKMICMNVPKVWSNICALHEGEEHNVYNKIGLELLTVGKGFNVQMQSILVVSLLMLFVGFRLCSNPIMIIFLLYTANKLRSSKAN